MRDPQLNRMIDALDDGNLPDQEIPDLLERLEAIEHDDTQPEGDKVAAILLRASIVATRRRHGKR
jgi:hypothetical protein